MIKYELIKVIFTQKVTLEILDEFIHINFNGPRKNVFSSETELMIDPEPFEFSIYNLYYDNEKNNISINYTHGNLIKNKKIKL